MIKLKDTLALTEYIGLYKFHQIRLMAHAEDKGLTLYSSSENGYTNCSEEELLSKIGSFNLAEVCDLSNTYVSDNSLIRVTRDDDKFSIQFQTISEDEYKKFMDVVKSTLAKTKNNTISVLVNGPGGFYLTPIGTLSSPITRDNYSDQVLEDFDFIVKDFNSKEPFGRLVVVNGAPGTGKTFMIRGLINEIEDSTIILMPPRLLVDLDGPSLLSTFIETKNENDSPIVLIIEDADSCLVSRASDNISSISALLNQTDGILGSLLNFRIIATTNQKSIDFDEALVRPGRLSRHVSVDYLSANRANSIYKRLSGDSDKVFSGSKISLAEVYARAVVKTNGELTEIESKISYNPGKHLLKSREKIGFGS